MTTTETRAKYTHVVKHFNGDAAHRYFRDEHSARQSHEKIIRRAGVALSEVRFSDFGGADCSPRIVTQWIAR